mgnify:FL=1
MLCSDGTAPAELAGVQAGVDATTWPAGTRAVVLPLRSVGVKADLRSYELPLCLSGPRPDGDLVASRLKSLSGINRLVWNLGPASGQVRVVPGTCTSDRVRTLQLADAEVTRTLRAQGLMEAVWQFPVVLLPLSFTDDPAGCAIVLRPVSSERGMTARVPELPQAFFDEVVPRILAIPHVTAALLDLSTKPPGTIEWE